jgi:hypothetical protein
MTSPLVIRPATQVDARDLERLAALDSAPPLTGDVMLAFAGGDVRAAVAVESGRAVADPFYPSAELVELLRSAVRPEPRRAGRVPRVRHAVAA